MTAPTGTDRGGDSAACYSLHELVRQYAAGRLAELPGEPAATQERHSSISWPSWHNGSRL